MPGIAVTTGIMNGSDTECMHVCCFFFPPMPLVRIGIQFGSSEMGECEDGMDGREAMEK